MSVVSRCQIALNLSLDATEKKNERYSGVSVEINVDDIVYNGRMKKLIRQSRNFKKVWRVYR